MSNSNRRGDAKIIIIIIACVCGAGVLVCAVFAALMLPAVGAARTAARTTQSKNNLKNIGLANHHYHDVHNNLPASSSYRKDSRPDAGAPDSWQVSLLPYLEQINLYESIASASGREWDSPQRRQAFRNRISSYLNPNLKDKEVLPNGLAATHYAGNSQVYRDKGMRFRDMVGGLSSTILAGEVNDGFRSWGDPANLRNPADGLGGGASQFGSANGQGVTVMVMADGSVHLISDQINSDILKKLADPTASPLGGF